MRTKQRFAGRHHRRIGHQVTPQPALVHLGPHDGRAHRQAQIGKSSRADFDMRDGLQPCVGDEAPHDENVRHRPNVKVIDHAECAAQPFGPRTGLEAHQAGTNPPRPDHRKCNGEQRHHHGQRREPIVVKGYDRTVGRRVSDDSGRADDEYRLQSAGSDSSNPVNAQINGSRMGETCSRASTALQRVHSAESRRFNWASFAPARNQDSRLPRIGCQDLALVPDRRCC